MVADAVGDRGAGKRIEIWFQDEARIGQKNALVDQWAKKGSRPTQPKDQRYDWAYLFAAVCPENGKTAAWVMPTANAETFDVHLGEISQQAGQDAIAVVVLDKAGWHGAKSLTIPDNIALLPLPPYSPELNPIENVWQYLRQTFLSNRVFETYDDIVNACCKAWNAFLKLPETITSITQREWATL